MKLLPVIIIGIALGVYLAPRSPHLFVQKTVQANTVAQVHQLTPSEIIAKAKHPEELMVIWKLESNMGKETNPQSLANYCRSQGKSNEFGYGGMAMKWCYDSFEDAVKVVDNWLDKERFASLCRYNTGIRSQSCWYSETAKQLLER